MTRELALSADGFRLGLKLRVFNYNLAEALDATGKPRYQVAREMGMSYAKLYEFLAFKRYPSEETKIKIAIHLGVPIDSIFPESIADIRLARQPEAISFTGEEAIAFGLVRETDPELEAERQDLRRLIGEALDTLSPREAKVIQLRFGLEDGRSRTLEAVGQVFGVTRTRIRAIEAKALRKLRHPNVSGKLRAFVVGERSDELPVQR